MVTFPKTDYESLIQDGRVHCSLYTDQSLFETELEKLWYREWIFIGHESEVPQSGDYTLKWLGLQPVIMTRDEDGGVNLLLNHCAHRGATVCQDESGNSHGFRCWYHGWTYNNKGDLIGVTFADNYDASFDMQEMGLARVPRVGSYRGFVFASMSPTGIDLDTHLGLAKTEILDRLCDLSPVGEVQISTGWLKHRVESNWKMMMENACDHYHANFTHQSTRIIGRSGTRAGVAGLVAGNGTRENETSGERARMTVRYLGHGHADYFRPDGQQHETPDDGRPLEGVAKVYFEALAQRLGEAAAKERILDGAPHAMIFPNLFVANQNLFVAQPLGVGAMVSYQAPVFLKGVPPEVNQRQLRRFEGASGPAGMLEQDDGEIWERNQRGLQTRMPEWQILRRGIHNERAMADGSVIAGGDNTDETPQRGFWRHYRSLMQA